MKHEPVFRVTKMEVSPMKATVHVEYGEHPRDRTTRERIVLHRGPDLSFELMSRNPA
jgi:hypothetical protein